MGVDTREWMKKTQDALTNQSRPIVVHWLIAINTLVFLIGFFGAGKSWGQAPEIYGYFSVFTAFDHGQLWRLITYQFLHANLGHIVLNMVGLWVFGQVVESKFGHTRFLLYYLICGIAAALFYTLLGSLGIIDPGASFQGMRENTWRIIPLVGASGSIYGVIAACAVLLPYARIQLLFPPINLSIRHFAIGVLAFSALIILLNWNNAGGEAGHMGGMLMGFAIMAFLSLKKKMFSHSTSREKNTPPSIQEIDEVLNKISSQGIDHLTDHDRRILREASSTNPFESRHRKN